MRFVTVNLYNGRADAADLERFLDRFDPDVLVAQEVGFDVAEVLRRRFPHGRVRGSDDYGGKALVGRLPVEVAPLPLPYRSGFRGRVLVDGAEVEVLGVHLPNPIDGLDKVALRGRVVEALLPLLAVPGRRILAGDLNSTPLWPAYRRLTAAMSDGVAGWAGRAGRRPERTWAPRPGWRAWLRIDHVLTQGLDVANATVAPIAGTDHRAVVVDLVPA